MFGLTERITTWLLERYLGKYVTDLDKAQVKLGVTGGKITFQNLNLKPEALVGLNLPIEVKAGHIGLLELTVPGVTSLYTDAVIVKVENVYLLSSPVCDRKYDEERDEILRQSRKKDTLDRLQKLLDEESRPKDGQPAVSADPGFLETMRLTILQNIQIFVHNVHIRYEDTITNPRMPFTFGITLEELSLQPSMVEAKANLQQMVKGLVLKRLAVYWNCKTPKAHLLKMTLATPEWKREMLTAIQESKVLGLELDYLIEPINGSAKLTINLQVGADEAKINCTGNFTQFVFNFKRIMFLNAIILKDSFAMMRVNEKYRKYSPGVPLLGNARAWWRYAYNAIVMEMVRPKSQFWARMWDYRGRYKAYREVYKERLLYPERSLADRISTLERDLNVESIVLARKEAEKQYLIEKPHMVVETPSGGSVLSRLSSWWWGKSGQEEITMQIQQPSKKEGWWADLSEDDRKKLYQAFHYKQQDTSGTTRAKYGVELTLDGVYLNLSMGSKDFPKHVCSLFVQNISSKASYSVQGVKFQAAVEHFEIFSKVNSTNKVHLARVDSSAGAGDDTKDKLIFLNVEQRPKKLDADVLIELTSRPVCVMYDHDVVAALMAFFEVPSEKFDLSSQLRSLQPEFSTASLQYAIDQHLRIIIQATLHSPYFVIPERGSMGDGDHLLIVDLGVLEVKTELQPSSLRLESTLPEERERLIYDKYAVSITDVKVMYASSKSDDWKQLRLQRDSIIHLVPSIELLIDLQICADASFRDRPQFKLDFILERIQVKSTESTIDNLLKFFYTFPLPSAEAYHDSVESSPVHRLYMDTLDHTISPAGMLMQTEGETEFMDKHYLECLKRLEEREIFITQGDLYNLWRLLSKKQMEDLVVNSKEVQVKDVEEMLLHPQGPTFTRLDSGDNGFVLAEDQMVKDQLQLPGLDSYSGTSFYTIAYFMFNVREVCLKLQSGPSYNPEDYITIVAKDMKGQGCRTSCCFSARVEMKSFSITDELHFDIERQPLRIASSPFSETMARVEFRYFDENYSEKIDNVAMALNFALSSIDFCVHDEATKALVEIVTRFKDRATDLADTQTEPADLHEARSNETMTTLHTAKTDVDVWYDAQSRLDTSSLRSLRSVRSTRSTKQPTSTKSDKNAAKVADIIFTMSKISCSLRKLSIALQKKFHLLAQAEISEIHASVEQHSDQMIISAKLGSLEVVDSQAQMYKQILFVEDGLSDVMTFRLISYSKAEDKLLRDQKIEVELRRMRLIYLNAFISNTMNFLSEVSAGSSNDAISAIRRSSVMRVQQSMQLVQKDATRYLLSVKVSSPLITVPESSNSHRAFFLRLGDVAVSNQFTTEMIGKARVSQAYDKMAINLKNIGIERIFYIDKTTHLSERTVLSPISFHVAVTRALPPVNKKAVDFDIVAKLDHIKMNIGQFDMQLLGKILYANLSGVEQERPAYDMHDGASSTSSRPSSQISGEPGGLAYNFALTMDGLHVIFKAEEFIKDSLICVAKDVANAVVGTVMVNLSKSKAKRDSTMFSRVTLTDLTIEDLATVARKEFETSRVIELGVGAGHVLELIYQQLTNGDSKVSISVQNMRFNVNMPFVKAALTLVQQSFSTWKPPAAPAPQPMRVISRRSTLRRSTEGSSIRHRRSIIPVSSIRKTTLASAQSVAVMYVDMNFGRQSLYMITGDGSRKALVAEVDVSGKMESSTGKVKYFLALNELTLYTTSLKRVQTHLKQKCLLPCSVKIDYSHVEVDASQPQPKVDIKLKLSPLKVLLSTNLIYHAMDAAYVLGVTKSTDERDVKVEPEVAHADDLWALKSINRDDWLSQYDRAADFERVEITSEKAATETVTLDSTAMEVKFAVAISQEYVNIMEMNMTINGSAQDWSTELRAQLCLSMSASYYNEKQDTWEPLLEPILDGKSYRNWEVLVRVATAASHPIAKTNPDEILVDVSQLDTFVHHQLFAVKERQKAMKIASQAPVKKRRVKLPPVEEPVIQPEERPHDQEAIATIQEETEADGVDSGETQPLIPNTSPVKIILTASDSVDHEAKSNNDAACASPDGSIDDHTAIVELKESEKPKTLCTYVAFLSRDQLLLNVSPQGIDVVSAVLDTFTKKPKDSVLFEVIDASPLSIRNLLGISASVALHKDINKHDVVLKDIEFDDRIQSEGIKLNRDFPPQRRGGTILALASSAAQGFTQADHIQKHEMHLQIDGFLPITNISFRRAQSKDFNTQARILKLNGLCVRIKTESKFGRRCVSIYSQLKLKNDLNVPVEIHTADAQENSLQPTGFVGRAEPGQWFYVPALVAQGKKLYIKPLPNETSGGRVIEFDECNEGLWWKEHVEKKASLKHLTLRRTVSVEQQTLSCSNRQGSIFCFKAVWKTRKCSAMQCDGSCPAFDIILKPTAIVENYLPLDIQFTIQAEEGSLEAGGGCFESTLRPGERAQLRNNLSVQKQINISIMSYDIKRWIGRLLINDSISNNAKFEISMSDCEVEGTPLLVLANISRVDDNQLKISLYSAYWLSNTSGIPLEFKASGLNQPVIKTADSAPVLFSVWALRPKLYIRLPGGRWSDGFSVDAVGTVGVVHCYNQQKTGKHRFMVETTLSTTQLTKLVTVFPMFVIINNYTCSLSFREFVALTHTHEVEPKSNIANANNNNNSAGTAHDLQWTNIEPDETKPFWPTVCSGQVAMIVKDGECGKTSLPFPPDQQQINVLRIGDSKTVTVQVSGGLDSQFFITLRPYQLGDAVVRLENLSSLTIQFYQSKVAADKFCLPPNQTVLYAWSQPMHERKLFWEVQGRQKPIEASITQDDLGTVDTNVSTLYWESYVHNLQRTLTFTDDKKLKQIVQKKNEEDQATTFFFIAMDSIGVSLINAHSLEVAFLSLVKSPSRWEVKQGIKWFELGEQLSDLLEKSFFEGKTENCILHHNDETLEIDVARMRFIQPIAGELKRESFPGLKFQYQQSEQSWVLQTHINHLQIDNQLPDAVFPIALYPTPLSKIELFRFGKRPCVQLFVRRQFLTDMQFDCYKRINVTLSEFTLKLDKGFGLTLFDVFKDCMSQDKSYEEIMMDAHKADIEYCMDDLAADTRNKTVTANGRKISIENLHFADFKFKISFSMTGQIYQSKQQSTQSGFGGDVLDFLLNSVGVTFTEVSDVEFRLKSFELTSSLITMQQLMANVKAFYVSQAIRQAYVFVFGLDIIGNPLGLARDMRKGLDNLLWSTKAAGQVHGSLKLGVQSAYANIAGSLSGAGSKITESVGSGFAMLSFDKQYCKKRMKRLRSCPSHLPASIVLSGKVFVGAVGSGLIGLVSQPLRGMKTTGATGFFKGVAKGVGGVFVKPVGGLFDCTSVLLDGCRRMTQYGDDTTQRQRNPRVNLPSDGVMRFHPYQGEGQQILSELSSFTYEDDNVYWAHIVIERIKRHKHIAIATTKNVSLLYSVWYASTYRIHWTVSIEDLDRKPSFSEGLLTLHEVKNNGDPVDRVIECDDHDILKWFHHRLLCLIQYKRTTY